MAEWKFEWSSLLRVKSHHVLIVVVIVAIVLLFHFRHKLSAWHDRYRTRRRQRYANVGSFEDDLESGLNSANFDINSNISAGDTRAGLLEEAAAEIKAIMKRDRLLFDEARLRWFNLELSENGIGEDGVPTDSRTVTFSRK